MKKRLFLAIPLTKTIRESFAQYQRSLNLEDVRWIPKKNLHITLYFLGDTDEVTIPEIIEELNLFFNTVNSFSLKFDKISLAPPGSKKPRIIWAEFEPNPEFENLMSGVRKILNKFAKEPSEHKEIIPHVTLARFKPTTKFNKLKLDQPKIEDLSVLSSELMSSHLYDDGSQYSIIASFQHEIT